jgi:hypothetical protein
MKITGQYLYQYAKNKAGLAYTGYLSPAVFNKYWEDAFFQAIEERFQQDQTQKVKDELSQFINSNVTVTNIGNNSLNIAPIVVSNMINVSGTSWTLYTNIPFAPQANMAQIYISGTTGFSTFNPIGVFNVNGFGQTVNGTTSINFTATHNVGGSYNQNSATFSLQNNNNLVPNQLIDYVHLLNVKCNFTKPVYVPLVSQSTGSTPVVCTLNWYNNFRTSSIKNDVLVTMSGWLTNTSANGSFYIKKINDLQFQLYSDINLQNPVIGIADETNNSVSLGLTYYNSARPYLDTEVISPQNTPTEKSPRYKITGNKIVFYGDPYLNSPCTQVNISYIGKPKLPYDNYQLVEDNNLYSGTYVDAADNNFDLTTLYSEKLLLNTTDRMIIIFSEFSRDIELAQFTTQQLQQNP